MDTERIVPAAEFTRNFGRYQTLAQQEAVAVSSQGRVAGYFIAASEYEAFKRFKGSRRSFATVDLSEHEAIAITASRMDARHDHLNALLDLQCHQADSKLSAGTVIAMGAKWTA